MAYTEHVLNTTPLAPPKKMWPWLYEGLVILATLGLAWIFHASFGMVEWTLFIAAVALAIGIGRFWPKTRLLILATAFFTLLSVVSYGHDMARINFLLSYVLSSQAAFAWMGAFFVLATLAYWAYIFTRSPFAGSFATSMSWTGVWLALSGLFVRWYESYLLASDIGHIPVSNLYEVFILFCLLTTLIYLYFEEKNETKMLGAFVMPIVSAAVFFLFWYAKTRDAAAIQPLVPALQSYWMKIHVPANFLGYGCFSVAAMVGLADLCRPKLTFLPSRIELHEWMYRSIAIGFVFFTLATILGALWAAQAWGGYWSWDPKETWALIVWLNYASWLHFRKISPGRQNLLSAWSVIGFFLTLFCFLGVNLFLSGLHSYGKL
jgi:cytochrome c-type biogenesis protein CcsB